MSAKSEQKRTLRAQIRVSRETASAEERAHLSGEIRTRLLGLPACVNTQSVVAAYLANGSEVSIDGCIEAWLARGLAVVAPTDGELPQFAMLGGGGEYRKGRYGLRLPPAAAPVVAESDLTVVVVPGLAFDATGARLGHGGGWYDRALALLAPNVNRIGVCFDFQVVDSIPTETHDQGVDVVITDERTIYVIRSNS